MNFSDRLKELRKESGITQVQLAKKIGLASQGAYRQYETGASKPQAERLQKLANIFDVSVSYLLGESNIRSESKLSDIMGQLIQPNQEKVVIYAQDLFNKQSNIISIEEKRQLYAVKVEQEQELSAGYGIGYTQRIEYDTVYTEKILPNFDTAHYIRGDSMMPNYKNWDVALIKFQPTPDYDGQICVIDDVENGDAYIKAVYLEEDALRLVSLNENLDHLGNRLYPDIFLPYEENPRIVGKIVSNFTPIEQ
jgi:Predicted transcriptional regulator